MSDTSEEIILHPYWKLLFWTGMHAGLLVPHFRFGYYANQSLLFQQQGTFPMYDVLERRGSMQDCNGALTMLMAFAKRCLACWRLEVALAFAAASAFSAAHLAVLSFSCN